MVTKNYLSIFSTTSGYEAALGGGGELDFPNVSLTEDDDVVHYEMTDPHDYSQDYLTFVVKNTGTFTFIPKNNNVISYSIDNGSTWTEGNEVTVNSGDKILWKGSMTPISSGLNTGIGRFSAETTVEFDVQGNIMSLLYGDNFIGKTDLTGKKCAFFNLFYKNIKLTNAKNLSLPATILTNYCYGQMFYSCTSLTTAPKLPATTLANSCYVSMFSGCTSLTTAPILSATTLVNNCYYYMFQGCTSLTTAPELPATTLVSDCYRSMFEGCSSLNYIKAMFTKTPSVTYTGSWVSGVSSTGTFVKNSAATWDVTGNNGVPTGWTVETASA